MREDTRALLEEIAHCPVTASCKSGHEHPCSRVVDVQRDAALSRHQVPEPWSGHLEQALVLFIGTSPAIARGEDCAVWSDPSDEIVGYFEARFGAGPRQIREGVYPPIPGGHSGTPLQSWVDVKARAGELIDEPVPGVDYAMTHAVHCRTQGELGLRPAMTVCPARYLRRVVAAAGQAHVLVALGPHAASAVRDGLGIPIGDDLRHVGPVPVEGRDRHVLYLDHFGGYGSVKEVGAAVDPETLALLRRELRGLRAGDVAVHGGGPTTSRPPADRSDEPLGWVQAAFRELTDSFEAGEAQWLAAGGRLHEAALSRVGWLLQRSVAGHGLHVELLPDSPGLVVRQGRHSVLRCHYAAVAAADLRRRGGRDHVIEWALARVHPRTEAALPLVAVAVGAAGAENGSATGRELDEIADVLTPRLGAGAFVERFRVEDAGGTPPVACLDLYLVGPPHLG